MSQLLNQVQLPSGVRLPYVEQGDPAGAAVVLLPGYSDSWYSYSRILPLLPESWHVFALTQRGHGDADRPDRGNEAVSYAITDFAADVRQFLDALDLPEAVIVGHSLGGTVAQQFAITHPARTRGLVLIGAFAHIAASAEVVAFCESTLYHLTDPLDPAFVREFQESTFRQALPPEFIDRVIAESLKMPAHVWRETARGFMQSSCHEALESIAAPTRLFWGAHDAFATRQDQEQLCRRIPGAHLTTYADAGHAPHWEEPQRLASELVAFVESLNG